MKTLGLIGGIGSGKSTVARMFCDLGAARIDADQIGHEVLLFPAVVETLKNRWGDGILNENGGLDRRKIAGIVFGSSEESPGELEFLKSLTHPLIAGEVKRRIFELKKNGCNILLFDAPLLLEAKWDGLVDQIIFVEAPRSVRLQRVLRRGWTEAEFDARENAQLPVDEKRRRADFIVDNAGFLNNTLDQIRKIWENPGSAGLMDD